MSRKKGASNDPERERKQAREERFKSAEKDKAQERDRKRNYDDDAGKQKEAERTKVKLSDRERERSRGGSGDDDRGKRRRTEKEEEEEFDGINQYDDGEQYNSLASDRLLSSKKVSNTETHKTHSRSPPLSTFSPVTNNTTISNRPTLTREGATSAFRSISVSLSKAPPFFSHKFLFERKFCFAPLSAQIFV